MKIKKNGYFFAIVLTLIFFSTFLSCKEKGPSESEKAFFLALHSIENKNEKEAIRFFKESSKSLSPSIRRKSLENLTLLGNVQDRNIACRNLLAAYKNSFPKNYDAILTACRELEKNSEYSDVLFATENLDIKNLDIPNELIQIRLRSLANKNSSSFEESFQEYYLNRTIQVETTRKIVRTTKYDFSEIEYVTNPVLKFRLFCSEKRYTEAFKMFQEVVAYMEENGFHPVVISDLGKSALYGDSNFESSAYKFENLLRKIPTTANSICFYNAHFYAGRFFSKCGNFSQAKNAHFKSAISIAKENSLDSQYDNAIWYLLNTTLSDSAESAINLMEEYAPLWKNPSYFDDVFDSLMVMLLTNQKFDAIPHILLQNKNYISKETLSKYAYISGRLLQEKLISSTDSLKSKQEQINEFFKLSLQSGNEFYYKILSAAKLKLSNKEIQKAIFTITPKYTENSLAEIFNEKNDSSVKVNLNDDIEKLLSYYKTSGFPSKIYGEWNNSYKLISKNSAMKAAEFLQNLGSDIDSTKKYQVQGLRIAGKVSAGSFLSEKHEFPGISKKIGDSDGISQSKQIDISETLTADQMKIVFPKFYKNEIENIASHYNLSTFELFSLVRSESFFVEKVQSHAGAIGLTQLMLPTAKDVAKKIKSDDSNANWILELKDALKKDEKKFEEMIALPDVNLTLGAFYLKELEERLEKQKILAYFAYNSGINNVRKWAKNIRKEYLKTKGPLYRTTGIAPDLFLEMLPFEETREYGRKLVTGSVLYGILYENSDCLQIIKEIFD